MACHEYCACDKCSNKPEARNDTAAVCDAGEVDAWKARRAGQGLATELIIQRQCIRPSCTPHVSAAHCSGHTSPRCKPQAITTHTLPDATQTLCSGIATHTPIFFPSAPRSAPCSCPHCWTYLVTLSRLRRDVMRDGATLDGCDGAALPRRDGAALAALDGAALAALEGAALAARDDAALPARDWATLPACE